MRHLIFASLLWAFSFGLIKGRLAGLDALTVASGRLFLAALVFAPLAIRAGRLPRRWPLFLALGAVLRREGWYPFAALEEAVKKTQRPEISKLNLAALEASAGLV